MTTTTRVRRPKKQPPKKRPTTVAPTAPTPSVLRFTVAQYLQIVAAGILPEQPRHELIHGWIVPKMSRNPPHDSALSRLSRRLQFLLGLEWIVRGQMALTTDDSVPEPDIVIVRGPEERYDETHPTVADVNLVVEVADSSLAADQTTKLAIYASERIPEYWIVNLVEHRIEVYTQPRAGRSPTYRQRTDYAAGQEIPVVLRGNKLGTIAVNDILPQ